jgi:cobalamin biosynthesis protein CobT
MTLLTAAVSNSLDRSTSRRARSSQVNRGNSDDESENEIIEMSHDSIHNEEVDDGNGDGDGEGVVEEEDNNDDDDEEQEGDTRENGASVPHSHSSTATVTSSTTSHTSSSSQSKSRRLSKTTPFFPSYDPMHIVTKEQLKALSLLVTTPIWIFDFIERKNKYSNLAGLELWSSPNLEEFLNRSMTDMSAAAAARTQECQNRVERGQLVQDMWTFYPKGKAKTVQMSK